MAEDAMLTYRWQSEDYDAYLRLQEAHADLLRAGRKQGLLGRLLDSLHWWGPAVIGAMLLAAYETLLPQRVFGLTLNGAPYVPYSDYLLVAAMVLVSTGLCTMIVNSAAARRHMGARVAFDALCDTPFTVRIGPQSLQVSSVHQDVHHHNVTDAKVSHDGEYVTILYKRGGVLIPLRDTGSSGEDLAALIRARLNG